MANEHKEIGDIIKKSKILLLDIEGTTTSISFVKDKLFPYVEENVKQFLDSQWEKEDVKESVAALRKMALEDQESSVEGVVAIPGEDASKEEQIEGVVGNVKWQMSSDRKAGPLKQLQGLIWKQGYDDGRIKGHVYDDVSPALEQWQSVDDQKVYIYSSGSVQAQKLLFGQSLSGDLLRYIDGHFDTAVGAKQESASYTKIVEQIGCKPEEILFLTDIHKEAEAARSAGLQVALVSREGNAPLPEAHGFPVVHSLAELTPSNKRKPEHSQEEQPAKVPKTVADDDVKSSNSESDITGASVTEEVKETAKMDVEEEPASTEKIAEEAKEEVTVEELTDTTAATAEVITEVEPVTVEKIEEKEGKTDEKETEKMEVEEAVVEEETKPAEAKTPVQEETPPTVICEIEEVSGKQLTDVAEIIDDVEPVVEEPAAAEDIEELQNVGEVLEKECDEILSKVQDVTNLDNIPIKPLLNPIVEEMETENNDSNDIVDKILDTELEMEMKQCENIDLDTISDLPEEVKKDLEVKDSANVEKPENSSEEDKKVETKGENDSEMETSQDKKEDKKVETNGQNVSEMETSQDKKEDKKGGEKNGQNDSEMETSQDKKEDKKVETNGQNVSEIETSPDETKVKEAQEPITAKKDEPVETVTDEKTEIKTTPQAAEENEIPVKETVPEKVAEDGSSVAIETPSLKTSSVKEPEAETNGTEEVKSKDETEKEPHVNGKTNGDAKEALNGDASKEEELNARLAVENGDEGVNGANGDSLDGEKGQGDSKVEAEVSEIKVKTVTTDEPRTDPTEQPTEA